MTDSTRASEGPHPEWAEDFAAQAEVRRRAGDPEMALELARAGIALEPRHMAGRVAAGLALLDLGRLDEARAQLEATVRIPAPEGVAEARQPRTEERVLDTAPAAVVAAPAPELSDLAEDELDQAFEEAAAERESMVDAEGIALQAVEAVERDSTHSGPELPGEAFRTHSMARLLEEQGDAAGAEAIRRALAEGEGEDAAPDAAAEAGDPARSTDEAPDAFAAGDLSEAPDAFAAGDLSEAPDAFAAEDLSEAPFALESDEEMEGTRAFSPGEGIDEVAAAFEDRPAERAEPAVADEAEVSSGAPAEAPTPAAAEDPTPAPAARAPRRGRKSRVEVLERWLHNVRRGRA